MEYCNFNLQDYIHPKTSESTPVFVREPGSGSLLQIWTVMSQIAAGVEYIHQKGQVHRDIKPENGIRLPVLYLIYLVLYSCKDAVWKLADFGLTVEGSSKTNRPTHYARGTPGYRAPELLEDDESTYTKKVDIWPMGCILYELATGTRAFKSDWAVLSFFSSGKEKEVSLDRTFDVNSINIITKLIIDMLQVDPSARPSASVLVKEFTQLYQFTRVLPPHLVGVSLHSASESGDLEAVKTLLSANADVNAQGGYFGNALQAASWKRDQPMVRLLLEKGADVNAQGGQYGNALQAASWGGDEAVFRLLLEKGADVHAQGGYFGNALQVASLEGNQAMVGLLLEKGADVNAQGGIYGNALQAASYGGDETIVRLLLEKGADVNAQGGHFGNALSAASERGNETVVQLLLQNGAKFQNEADS